MHQYGYQIKGQVKLNAKIHVLPFLYVWLVVFNKCQNLPSLYLGVL